MSQEAVERFLGRMLTDQRFRTLVGESLESASQSIGANGTSAYVIPITFDGLSCNTVRFTTVLKFSDGGNYAGNLKQSNVYR